MTADRIGDPVISDSRVRRAEMIVRKMIPGIPEDSIFASYVQERGPAEYRGTPIDTIPEVAVFFIKSANPRHPDFSLIERASCWLSVWKQKDKNYKWRVGETDPAVTVFAIAARKHVETLANLRAMN